MKENILEYYWESMSEKQERGDLIEGIKDFFKLMEVDADYKEYCYRKRDEEGWEFLVPMIDYYWWKENIKGKDKLK